MTTTETAPAATAPLPSAAAEALARLELALVVAPRLEACTARYEQLATHADDLCSAEFDRMLCAVDEMGHCRDIQRAVTRYGICRDTLAELEGQRITTPAQFNELKNAQDGLAEARKTLAAAGRLDLIEAVA